VKKQKVQFKLKNSKFSSPFDTEGFNHYATGRPGKYKKPTNQINLDKL
jgi:hypothetical protein